MKRISMVSAILWLTVLIPIGSSGQQAPESPAQKQENKLPPLKAQCQAEDQDFVKGQNLEIRCVFLIKENVTLNLDDLKQITTDRFEVVGLSSTKPVPMPNQKDYNAMFVTEVLKPNPELEYGRYALKLELNYSYPEVKWQEVEGKQILITRVKRTVEKIPEIIFEKKPLIARIETGDGFQNVINIGEHIQYTLRIFSEKDAVVLLNNLSPIELEQKFGIKNATPLNEPDFNPFVLINKDDPLKKKETNRGFHQELSYEYRLALYEVSLVKTFDIPPINLYYFVFGGNKLVQLTTQTTKVRTNSVLNRDGDLRPLKGILEPDPDKLLQRGVRPLRVAYAMAILAGLIILYAVLAFAGKHIKKVRQLGLYASLVGVKNSIAIRFDKIPLVAKIKTQRALEKLCAEPNQKNLKIFINQLRIYFGTLVKMPKNLALSHTAAEFRADKIKNVEVLETAELLLDEEVVGGNLCKLDEMLKKLKKTRR